MIDTHCHIQVRDYDADRDAVLARAAEEGVEAIVVPAIDEASFDATLAMAAHTAPRVACAIGVHPHHAAEVTPETLARITTLMDDPRVVAVGEIGLDYHYDFAPRDVQQRVLREQVRIAKRAGKPVIVHNRESDDDVLAILGDEQDGSLRGVLHCFSSTVDMLHRALAIGLHVSFTGNITFKNSALGDVVREAPLEKIMLETDAPWMSPPPWRGKRNEPQRVQLVAAKIAEVKGLPLDEVLRRTTANAKRFFGLAALAIILCASSAFAQLSPTPLVTPPARDTVPAPKADTVVPVRFYRLLGVGGGIGSSTLQPPGSQTAESNLFTYFLQGTYMLSPVIGVDVRYWHFSNFKSGYQLRTDIDTIPSHQGKDLNDYYSNLDLGVEFVFNPHNPVTIGGTFGASHFSFYYPLQNFSYSMWGFYGSLVISFNLQFDWGLLHPFGEYRIVQELGTDTWTGGATIGTELIPVLTFGVLYYFPENFHY